MRRASAINALRGFVGGQIPISTQKTRATREARGRKRHFYKPLPKEFRHDGFDYRQIAREGDTAIYEQVWNDGQNPNVSYEVIRIRRREAFQNGVRFVEPHK